MEHYTKMKTCDNIKLSKRDQKQKKICIMTPCSSSSETDNLAVLPESRGAVTWGESEGITIKWGLGGFWGAGNV